MSGETLTIHRRLFIRLCRGENLILSRNGPKEDAELFEHIEADDESEKSYRSFFGTLGFYLQKSDNCYYFTTEDEPQSTVESKLDKTIRLVRLLDFLSRNIENFGEGQIFSATALAARCNGDPKAERFLHSAAKSGATNADRLDGIIQSLMRQGYLSEYDPSRNDFKVLSAINYLWEFADRITILEEQAEPKDSNAEA